MADTIVFAGPSLHRVVGSDREELLSGAELRPPAKRGDITACMVEDAHTLVLLDGYFFTELAVAHKEILYALEAGRRVIGAASMGALRAAEMAPMGMMGVGTIFDWYREGRIDGDDEVTVMHLPDELGSALVTVALVEVRYALDRMVERGIVPRSGADLLVEDLKQYSFSGRTPELIATLAAERLQEGGAHVLREEMESFSLKEEDARLAIHAAREPFAGSKSMGMKRSMFYTYWCEDHTRVPAATGSLPSDPTLMHGFNVVQLFHDQAPEFVEAIRLRYISASAAEKAGLEVDPNRQEEVASLLREHVERAHGGAVLPPWEVDAEARIQVLSEAACHAFGGALPAGDWLATEFGLDAAGGCAELVTLLSHQYGRLSSWALIRAFVFTTTLRQGLVLAEAANEVYRCFQRWSRGARIDRADLVTVASEFWDCRPEEVDERARARGLLESHGFSVGLHEILKRVAPAERLPEPINEYAALKVELKRSPLEYALPLFPDIDPDRPARITAKPAREDFPVIHSLD
jgi:hypothetical protein